MSYAKLRGKIKEVFGTQKAFASAMGMDLSTVSEKLNDKSAFKQDEIIKACEVLSIPIEEVALYFFTKKVGKLQHEE